MSETKPKRLSAVVAIYNVATSTIVEYLASKGIEIENNPNAKVQPEWLALLDEKFKDSKVMNETAIKDTEKAKENKELNISIEKQQNLEKQKQEAEKAKEAKEKERLQKEAEEAKPQEKPAEVAVKEETKPAPKPHEIQPIEGNIDTDENGPKVLGKINLDQINQNTRPKRKTAAEKEEERRQKEEELRAAKDPLSPLTALG